jgi:putative spermidine/putrescine transport system substrate-binding protein
MRSLLAHAEMAVANQMNRLVSAARQEGQLTVAGLARDWCRYGKLIDGFKAKYSLAVYELFPNAPSAFHLETIARHRRDPALPAPDVIDIGLSFGPAAKRDGLLQPYKVSNWDTIPGAVKDADGFWYGTYSGVLAFEINTDLVKNMPDDWPSLLASEYRNCVALAGDPLSSSLAIQAVYASGFAISGGNRDRAAADGLRFFAELHRRGNLVPLVGDTDSLRKGITPILIRWDYLGLADQDRLAGNPSIEIVVPKSGTVGSAYVQSISACAPHPNAAKLWMEYLYSDESQLTMLNGCCHPIRFDDLVAKGRIPIRARKRVPDNTNEEASEHPVLPTPEEQDRAREIITKGWDDAVGVKIICPLCPPPPVVHPRPPTSLNDVPRGTTIPS